jgi:uncharacterized membrane protein
MKAFHLGFVTLAGITLTRFTNYSLLTWTCPIFASALHCYFASQVAYLGTTNFWLGFVLLLRSLSFEYLFTVEI